MWFKATEGGGGKADDGHFIFDAGFLVHSLCIRVGEAHDEFLSAVRNGDTAGLSRSIFGDLVRCDGRRQGDAIDEVVVLERAFGVVLDGDDLGVFLVCTRIESIMQQALDEIKPGLIVGVIVSHGCQGRETAAEGSLVGDYRDAAQK